MIDVKRFKKSFFLGRLIWVKGAKSSRKAQIVFDILSSCQVKREEVLVLTPDQFVDMVNRGLNQATVIQYEVFLIQGFETLSAANAEKLLKCMETFRSLQMGFGIRMVLLSELSVTQDLQNFKSFRPVVVKVSRSQYDPGDLNERVHYLVEQAIRITDVPVKRISEQAAYFLEHHFSDEADQDVLELLVIGLTRCDGQVLRFKDFLPRFRFDSDSDQNFETCCN